MSREAPCNNIDNIQIDSGVELSLTNLQAELVNDDVLNDAPVKEKKKVKDTPILRATPMVPSCIVFSQPQVIYVAPNDNTHAGHSGGVILCVVSEFPRVLARVSGSNGPSSQGVELTLFVLFWLQFRSHEKIPDAPTTRTCQHASKGRDRRSGCAAGQTVEYRGSTGWGSTRKA